MYVFIVSDLCGFVYGNHTARFFLFPILCAPAGKLAGCRSDLDEMTVRPQRRKPHGSAAVTPEVLRVIFRKTESVSVGVRSFPVMCSLGLSKSTYLDDFPLLLIGSD